VLRVMLDLETLGTGPDAVVTAIGVCRFDEMKTLYTGCRTLDYTKDPGDIDPGTLRWWLKQDRQVANDMLTGTEDPAIVAVWLDGMLDVKEVWANAPTFDCTILRNWYHRVVGREAPWHWRNERCMRTMYGYARHWGIALPPVDGAAHDAGADAYRQAIHLLHIEGVLNANPRG